MPLLSPRALGWMAFGLGLAAAAHGQERASGALGPIGAGGGPALTIDARQAPIRPAALAFAAGGRSPSGHVLGANRRYLTRDGQPWFPVMGEFHFARYPADEWEKEILKMKAGGIRVVSTYIFWIFHEETEGQFDWTGQRDLRRFVQLCAKHGLQVWLRIGPWAHGEVRNGGFPDWLVGGPTRQNDPAYLARVEKFYGQIGRQVAGLLWQDGGPIVGVQIENEYHPRSGGAAHLEELLRLARAAGIVAPFYTVTGWDRAAIPAADFLPVFGGYTEQFWSASRQALPPNPNFFFTPIRAEDNVMGDLQPKTPSYNSKYDGYPYLTAEMGGGMAIAYHRRPVVQADDSAAAALVRLGSGITLLGYYMYHGGTNPDGRTAMQETQSGWNGGNDLEAKSYDFQAPIGEWGQLHGSYRTLKALHLFLNDFGGELAPMASYLPDQMPRGVEDTSTPRAALRSDGTRGFLFINNYERTYALPPHRNFQVAVQLAGGTLRIPREPTTVPGGVYTIWPVNLDVGGVTLSYATAQPACRLAASHLLVFFAWPGLPPEFSFRTEAGDAIEAPSAQVSRREGQVLVTGIDPGTHLAIRVRHPGRESVQILVLSRAQALNLWQADLAGRERLLLSPAGLDFDQDRVRVESSDPADFQVGIFPAVGGAIPGFRSTGHDGIFQQFAAAVPAAAAMVAVRAIRAADPARPARLNPNPQRHLAMEPTDADFDRAAVWTLRFPPSLLTAGSRPVLRIKYQGDVARLYAGGRFLDDNFYRGTPFEFGLWRLTPQELQDGLELKILPLRRDTPLYLPPGAAPAFAGNGEALELQEVSVAWDYQAVMDLRR
jgi:beta-galactosidase